MGQMMLLSDIATVSSGYLFRSKLEHSEGGQYKVIQMKDVDACNNLDMKGLARVNINSLKQEYLIRKDDIIFRSRGQQNLATLVEQPLENTIAVSQFFIIRVKCKDVISAYLAWYINQKPAQQELNRRAAGSNTQHINKSNLEQLEIEVPSMELQRKVVELHKLGTEEERIMTSIRDGRKKLLHASAYLYHAAKIVNHGSTDPLASGQYQG